MLKHLVPKFFLDVSVRLKDVAEKQALAKLKAIVVTLIVDFEVRYADFQHADASSN